METLRVAAKVYRQAFPHDLSLERCIELGLDATEQSEQIMVNAATIAEAMVLCPLRTRVLRAADAAEAVYLYCRGAPSDEVSAAIAAALS